MAGVLVGIIVGAIPGLTGAMLIALLLPVTFQMQPFHAVASIVGVYVGSVSGGLITAVMLRMPGTVSNLMTMLDGYPMAQQGKARRAIALSVGASLLGGVLSWLVLAVLSEPISLWATRFTPFDYFALVILALAFVVTLSEKALLKGLLAAALGFLLALPGIDPSSAQARMTFGMVELNAGIQIMPFFVGMFAFGAVLSDIVRGTHLKKSVKLAQDTHGANLSLQDLKTHGSNLIRSSAIGTGVGILPGIGSNIASVVSYTLARNFSKNPEIFGKGAEEGIVASETANNAAVGGALIPTLALGVPGSLVDVLLLTALTIHAIQPGPMLFVNSGDLAYGLIATYIIATLAMAFFVLTGARWLAMLARVPLYLLLPIIIVASVIGAYALEGTAMSLWVMLAFGGLGVLMEWLDYPLAPFAIAFVLGPIAEAKLRTGLQITAGDWSPLYSEPTPLALFAFALIVSVFPIVKAMKRKF
ncbi:tripartite tricarboxylate transporter permease [Hoeflea prorocentri]|uniref:Tripartite tricarboxylate transporter permease n=1 Tax=Hoeflea prorocentri TaxID=1922333 RepID=A0A9X3ULL8_9HYPH|nr:tripartite tricarboxylate transporter permease [Hoeflea prorocentri]MCY6382869.1 tripartite tricarboxylate transporter permease [Hoeflea prorocentri]MDA5400669.1 tripartite tricarboxylate transporter permease [Hoeflea prorocentri]